MATWPGQENVMDALFRLGRPIERALRKTVGHRIERVLMGHRRQLSCRYELHGKREPYAICPGSLSAESLVYSFGLGRNISFELSLIEKYGASVYAFDPTPAALSWVRDQALPPQFTLFDYGIAEYDGTARLYPNERPDRISHSLLERPATAGRAIEVPVYRLGTIMERLGSRRIDVLKMDIEGSEYGVIEDLIRSQIPVSQVLVEFHHRFKNVGRARTREAVRLLNRHGYQVFYLSDDGREYSFARTCS
jgi:FkbM family methyltransferase